MTKYVFIECDSIDFCLDFKIILLFPFISICIENFLEMTRNVGTLNVLDPRQEAPNEEAVAPPNGAIRRQNTFVIDRNERNVMMDAMNGGGLATASKSPLPPSLKARGISNNSGQNRATLGGTKSTGRAKMSPSVRPINVNNANAGCGKLGTPMK